jgi:hypothetical protein
MSVGSILSVPAVAAAVGGVGYFGVQALMNAVG